MSFKFQEIEAEHLSWTAPLPLCNELGQMLPYPVDALPTLIRNAVINYQHYGQQPLPLIACSALANVSLAAKHWPM